MESFFDACPDDLDCIFVVIQHLSPDHKSLMNELLARHTSMPVCMVSEGLKPEKNRVYLIPAGTTMTITAAGFQLIKKQPHQLTMPIDIFLQSAVTVYNQRCIAVICSGTGTDGTKGILALDKVGGAVFIQQPDEAKFDGMPKSAIATGVPADIFPIHKIPAAIQYVIRHPEQPVKPRQQMSPFVSHQNRSSLQDIIQALSAETGINFQDYKDGTLERRIEKRMQFRRVRSNQDYLDLLTTDRQELQALHDEVLLPVTQFFRDEGVWLTLEKTIASDVVAAAVNKQNEIRCWVAGVSKGQEAYSLAMLLIEACEREHIFNRIKIFATDVNKANIEQAAQGIYSKEELEGVSELRVARFFDEVKEGYQVKPTLRQCIVFACHNLLTDAPFTRMHIVSCRNVLIYFKPEAQTRVLLKLMFAVEMGGVLVLGKSESLPSENTGFDALSVKGKIFRRETNPHQRFMPMEIETQRRPKKVSPSQSISADQSQAFALELEVCRNMLLQNFAPPRCY